MKSPKRKPGPQRVADDRAKAQRRGELLEEARLDSGMTRRDVVEAFNKQSAAPLHEITLYKYEKGKLTLPRQFATILAGILKLDVAELVDGSRDNRKDLKFGSLPHTDSELLEFALTIGRLDDANPNLPRTIFKGEPVTDSMDLLAKLNTGAIDLGFFNTTEFEMQPGAMVGGITRIQPVVAFHSYAVLLAPPAQGQWLSFQEWFNRQDPAKSRRGRLELALRDTLLQLFSQDGTHPPDVLFAPSSDRRTLLKRLTGILKDQSDSHSAPFRALQASLESNPAGQDSENHCYNRFLQILADPSQAPNGAIFVGTIPQRLIAEARGARILITPENLAWLSAEHAGEAKFLQPTNSLLVNRETLKNEPEQIDAAIIRWNAAVAHINSPASEGTRRSYIAGSIREQMKNSSVAPDADDPSVDDLARRIFAERLIVLLPHPVI